MTKIGWSKFVVNSDWESAAIVLQQETHKKVVRQRIKESISSNRSIASLEAAIQEGQDAGLKSELNEANLV